MKNFRKFMWLVLMIGICGAVVFAADYNLGIEPDVKKAQQHINEVQIYDISDSSKTASLVKNGSNSGLEIRANNLVISKQDGSSDDSEIIGSTNSSILGGKQNKISDSLFSTIFGGYYNIIKSQYVSIGGGSQNEIEGSADYSVIVGGDSNKIGDSVGNSVASTIIGGVNNIINGNFSAVVGNNIKLEGKNSVALGFRDSSYSNSSIMKADNSFIWTDNHSDEVLEANDVFVIMSDNGLAVNTSASHTGAQLTIGGSLVVSQSSLDNDIICENGAGTGIIKLVDKGDGSNCLCSCDGNQWNSLFGRGQCKSVCEGVQISSQAKCDDEVQLVRSADGSKKVYSGTCISGEVIGDSYYVARSGDNSNVIYWSCQEKNGHVDMCHYEVGCEWVGETKDNKKINNNIVPSLDYTGKNYHYNSKNTGDVCSYSCEHNYHYNSGTKTCESVCNEGSGSCNLGFSIRYDTGTDYTNDYSYYCEKNEGGEMYSYKCHTTCLTGQVWAGLTGTLKKCQNVTKACGSDRYGCDLGYLRMESVLESTGCNYTWDCLDVEGNLINPEACKEAKPQETGTVYYSWNKNMGMQIVSFYVNSQFPVRLDMVVKIQNQNSSQQFTILPDNLQSEGEPRPFNVDANLTGVFLESDTRHVDICADTKYYHFNMQDDINECGNSCVNIGQCSSGKTPTNLSSSRDGNTAKFTWNCGVHVCDISCNIEPAACNSIPSQGAKRCDPELEEGCTSLGNNDINLDDFYIKEDNPNTITPNNCGVKIHCVKNDNVVTCSRVTNSCSEQNGFKCDSGYEREGCTCKSSNVCVSPGGCVDGWEPEYPGATWEHTYTYSCVRGGESRQCAGSCGEQYWDGTKCSDALNCSADYYDGYDVGFIQNGRTTNVSKYKEEGGKHKWCTATIGCNNGTFNRVSENCEDICVAGTDKGGCLGGFDATNYSTIQGVASYTYECENPYRGSYTCNAICSAGTYWNGSYCDGDTTPTVTCAPGQYLKANETQCSTCPCGYYCEGGTFSEKATDQGKTACSSTKYSQVGASSCSSCASGQQPNSTQCGCETISPNTVTCTAGKYLPKDSMTCSNCPCGYYCPGGMWSKSTIIDQGKMACGAGKWSSANATGSNNCLNINCGYYGTNECSATPSTKKCTGNTSYSTGGQSSCSTCASTKVAESNHCACTCPTGTQLRGNVCVDISTQTITCSRGQYLPANSTTCSACPCGNYCPGGIWSKSTLSQGIKQCAAGEYSTGWLECASCGAGMQPDSNGCGCEPIPTQTVTCGVGQYLPANSMTCSTCPCGYYCPGGTWTKSTAVQGRNKCAAGKYSTQGASSCSSCTSGQQPNSTQCGCETIAAPTVTCAAGKYLPANSMTCSTCPCGYYCPGGIWSQSSNIQGRNECGAGKWSNAGASNYSSCSNINCGYYGTNACSATPNKCAAGEYSTQGASSCSSCASGKQPNSTQCGCEDRGCSAGSLQGLTNYTLSENLASNDTKVLYALNQQKQWCRASVQCSAGTLNITNEECKDVCNDGKITAPLCQSPWSSSWTAFNGNGTVWSTSFSYSCRFSSTVVVNNCEGTCPDNYVWNGSECIEGSTTLCTNEDSSRSCVTSEKTKETPGIYGDQTVGYSRTCKNGVTSQTCAVCEDGYELKSISHNLVGGIVQYSYRCEKTVYCHEATKPVGYGYNFGSDNYKIDVSLGTFPSLNLDLGDLLAWEYTDSSSPSACKYTCQTDYEPKTKLGKNGEDVIVCEKTLDHGNIGNDCDYYWACSNLTDQLICASSCKGCNIPVTPTHCSDTMLIRGEYRPVSEGMSCNIYAPYSFRKCNLNEQEPQLAGRCNQMGTRVERDEEGQYINRCDGVCNGFNTKAACETRPDCCEWREAG